MPPTGKKFIHCRPRLRPTHLQVAPSRQRVPLVPRARPHVTCRGRRGPHVRRRPASGHRLAPSSAPAFDHRVTAMTCEGPAALTHGAPAVGRRAGARRQDGRGHPREGGNEENVRGVVGHGCIALFTVAPEHGVRIPPGGPGQDHWHRRRIRRRLGRRHQRGDQVGRQHVARRGPLLLRRQRVECGAGEAARARPVRRQDGQLRAGQGAARSPQRDGGSIGGATPTRTSPT